MYNDPFGRQGAGAPNLYTDGHVNTQRSGSYERATVRTQHTNMQQSYPDMSTFQSAPKTSRLPEGGGTLNLMSWSEREKNRKEREKEEWLKQL